MREWLCVHWIAVFLALILTGGACFRVVSFIGYGYDGDDVGYAQLAHNIVTGEFLQAHLQTPLIFPSRIGIVAPASASFKLWSERADARSVSVHRIHVGDCPRRTWPVQCSSVRAWAYSRPSCTPSCRWTHGTGLFSTRPAAALWLNAAILMIYVGSKSPIGLRKTVLGGFAGLPRLSVAVEGGGPFLASIRRGVPPVGRLSGLEELGSRRGRRRRLRSRSGDRSGGVTPGISVIADHFHAIGRHSHSLCSAVVLADRFILATTWSSVISGWAPNDSAQHAIRTRDGRSYVGGVLRCLQEMASTCIRGGAVYLPCPRFQLRITQSAELHAAPDS